MMDQATLDYDFDEEGDGFGEPETPVAFEHSGKLPLAAKLSLALVGVGPFLLRATRANDVVRPDNLAPRATFAGDS